MPTDSDQGKSKVNESLGTSLVESASKAGVADIAAEVAEIALDSILDDGLLKEVPVFGLLIKSYSVIGAVRDRIFLKKVANFLAGVGGVSEGERREFLGEIENDPGFTKKVGESIVLLLERQEDFEKARILGKAFSRYIRGQIDYEKFLKVAKSIELAFIGDLQRLDEYYRKMRDYDPKSGKSFTDCLDDQTSQSLYTSGLVRSSGWTENTYHLNDVGEELLRCLVE